VDWGVAEAKQRLSELLRKAQAEPQVIRRRGELVAAVIGPDDAADYLTWRARKRSGSLADALAELRRVAAEESYELPRVKREDRLNPMMERRARRHERRE